MDETTIGIVIIAILVIIGFKIRADWVKTKRTMHNTFRAIKEVEDYDQIEAEEDAKRMFNRMTEQPKKSGGFGKALLVIVIIGVVLYFIMKS